jgi:uncharacterized protein (TIGR00369 family)
VSERRPAAIDPTLQARVRENFARQRVMTMIGARLTHIAPGETDIELPFRDDLTQQDGFLHAGVIATLADSACGYAAYTLMSPTAGVLSIEFKVNLLAPAIGSRVTARARVLRAGRTITVVRADVAAERDGVEKLVATMLGTMMAVGERAADRNITSPRTE